MGEAGRGATMMRRAWFGNILCVKVNQLKLNDFLLDFCADLSKLFINVPGPAVVPNCAVFVRGRIMQEASKTPKVALLTFGVCVGWALTLIAAARALGLG